MTEPNSVLETIDQISDIARRIVQRLDELRPVAEQIEAGSRDPALLEKNRRLQEEINSLHEKSAWRRFSSD